MLFGRYRHRLPVAEPPRLAVLVDGLKALVGVGLFKIRELPNQLNIAIDADLRSILSILDFVFHFVMFFSVLALRGLRE